MARYSPCSTNCTPPSPRWIWPIRATVPIVCRFSARRLLHVLALGEREDQPLLVLQRRLDRAQGAGSAGADRGRHAGEQHHVAQGKDGECHAFGHRPLSSYGDAGGTGNDPSEAPFVPSSGGEPAPYWQARAAFAVATLGCGH